MGHDGTMGTLGKGSGVWSRDQMREVNEGGGGGVKEPDERGVWVLGGRAESWVRRDIRV